MNALIIVLLLTGFVLLAVELVVIPGFGVAGILGALALLAGSILSFRQFGALWGSAAVVGTIVLCIVAVIVVGKSRVGKSLALKRSAKSKAAVPEELETWVGREGVSESMLRPSGSALFGDERMTVLTEGQFLEKGTRIRVSRVEGGKLVVEPVEEPAEESGDKPEEADG